MKILITGGAGFIGSNLARFHLMRGDEVTVVDNLVTGKKENIEEILTDSKFTFIQEDIVVYRFAGIGRMDVVYDLASPASPPHFEKYAIEILMVNSQGTKNVLDFMRNTKSKRLVFTSTSEVYGDPKIHPQKETYWGNVNPVGPRSCYDEAKRFAEALITTHVRKYHLDCRVVRVFNTYGPSMDPADGRVISNFINQALENRPMTIYGKGDQTRSFCFVDDMVEGLYRMGNVPNLQGAVVNIGNPMELTVLAVAKKIKELTKSNSKIVFLPLPTDDPKKRRPDISKAKKLLDWSPKISLVEGLKKTIQYYRTL